MGDKDFEDFLNQGDRELTQDCQKRLLLNILELKLNSVSDQMSNYLEASKDNSVRYRGEIDKLQRIADDGFGQLDFLLATVLEEMGLEDDKDGADSDPLKT